MRSPPVLVGGAVLVVAAAVAAVLVVLQLADDSPGESEPSLTAILTSPRSIVFSEVGETASLGVVGIYSDRSERSLPDQSGLVPAFSSSDPGVATVDSSGQVTAIAPGGIDIFAEYEGFRAAATVIVYAPFAEIPPYDPDLVVQPDEGSAFVLNRVLVKPLGDAYDGALAGAIAADHGASLLAEWKNLAAFLLEYDIDTIEQLYHALMALDADDRVVAYQLDYLHSPAQTAGEPGTLPRSANVFEAWSELERLGHDRLSPVHIAVVDLDLSLLHADPERQRVIRSEIIGPQFVGPHLDVTGTVVEHTSQDESEGFSHGLAVSSIIAGQDKVRGIVSNAPNVHYTLHFYSMDAESLGSDDAGLKNVLDHLSEYMAKVDVVNMSFGSQCNDRGVVLDLLFGILGERLQELPNFGHVGGLMDRTNIDILLKQIPGHMLEIALGPTWTSIIETGLHELDKLTCDVIVGLALTEEYSNIFTDMSNTVFVVAAGNSAADVSSRYEYYPAVHSLTYENVFTVGAIDSLAWSPLRRRPAEDRACFSNYGEAVTVAAEGQQVYVLDLRDRKSNDRRPPGVWYSELPGTSFAAPIVTSVVALLRAIDPSLTTHAIKEILTETSDVVAVDQVKREDCGSAKPDNWASVNAGRAVATAIARAGEMKGDIAEELFRVFGVAPLGDEPSSVALTATPTPSATPLLAGTASVSAGWAHTCAVQADGSVLCWGDNGEGQASPPGGEFLSVSAGEAHSCGIRTDRSVACWGKDNQGQASPPDGQFLSVSAGWEDTCGVRTDGSLECWGRVTTFNLDKSPDVLFRSVSVALFHACGVTQDGSVECWGQGATSPPSSRFSSVSVGNGHSCGVRTDGSVACWGKNDEGQASPPPGTFDSVSASMDGRRTCGVRTDGSAICWGSPGIARPGARIPVPLEPEGRFSSISAGEQHVCGVRPDGQVACWGRNERGQAVPPGVSLASVRTGTARECGLRVDGSVACYGNALFRATSVPPGSFTSLSAGARHNCAIKEDGALVCWGWNPYGQATAPAGTFVAISLAATHSCGLREGGEIECWGNLDHVPPDGPFTGLATSQSRVDGCGIRRDGSVECWGEHVSEENGPPDGTFTSVAVGWGHACGIRTDGTVACWGNLNTYGEASPPSGRFVAISLGNSHSCGLREGGEIECWGQDSFGKTEAPEGTFISIDADEDRTCAVREGGSSYVCWGYH